MDEAHRKWSIDDAWPLVGREAELTVLTDALEQRRGVVLAGAAGVGKTRLLRAVRSTAEAQHWATAWLVASRSSADIPLGVFAAYLEDSDVGGASALARVRRALLDRAAGRALVCCVDDGHALDGPSSVLLHQLVAAGDAVAFVTVRSGEMVPDPVDALWKDDFCDRVEVLALSEREVDTLLHAVLRGPVEAASVHALWEVSRGNVMLLREVVRDARQSGTLVQGGGGLWSWSRPARFAPRLEALLIDRIDALDPADQPALEMLALGTPLTWTAFRGLVGDATADRLAAADWVAREPGSGGDLVMPVHPLVGELLVRRLPSDRRRAHLAALADAVERDGSPGPEARLRITTWRREAGEPVAPDLLVGASRTCLYSDPRQAEALARAAMEAGAGFPAIDLLVQVLNLTHRAGEAETLLSTVDPEALPRDDRTRLVLMRANNLTWGLGRPDDAVALLGTELARADGPEARDRMRAHLPPVLLFAGRLRDAVEVGEALFADADRPAAVRLDAALGLLPAMAACGAPATMLTRVPDALALVDECRDELPVATAQIVSAVTLAQQWVGDLAPCEALMQQAFRDGVANDAPLQRAGAALRLAQVQLWRGRARAAIGLLREGIAALGVVDAGLLDWTLQTMRLACAWVGDRDGLALADATARTALRFPLYDSERARAEAAVAALHGDRVTARRITAEACRTCTDDGLLVPAALLAWDLVRYGDVGAGAATLGAIAPSVEGVLVAGLAATSAALVDDDLDGLERASAAFEAGGYLLLAAEAARLAAARAASRGLRARAAAADARADRLVPRAEGLLTPLLAPRAGAARLTPREHEVAALAAEGRTDAEIAQLLGVSVRTVETHLHRVYGKCGVTGRRELSAVFGG